MQNLQSFPSTDSENEHHGPKNHRPKSGIMSAIFFTAEIIEQYTLKQLKYTVAQQLLETHSYRLTIHMHGQCT